jgi:hypothetical protein
MPSTRGISAALSSGDLTSRVLLYSACVVLGLAYLAMPGYLFLILLLLAAVFALGAVRPEYSLYLMVLVLVEEMVHFFVTIPPLYEVRVYPYQLVMVATMAGLAFLYAASKERIRRTPVDVILWIVVTYEICSILWTPHFFIGLSLSMYLLTQLALFHVVTSMVLEETVLRRVVKTLVVAGVVSAASIILSNWIDVSTTVAVSEDTGFRMAFKEHEDRPAGLAGVDHAAGFTSIAAVFTMGSMVWEKRKKVKALYFLILLFMLYGIILTASRGVIIGFSGAYMFFILLHGKLNKRFVKYAFLFIALAALIVLLAKPGLVDRMLVGFGYTGELLFSDKKFTGTEAKTELGQGLSGLEIRFIWWANALDEMLKNPLKLLFGLGIGGFTIYSAGENTVTSPEVNSVSFAFFYDMGLIGVIFFIILAYALVKHVSYWVRNARMTYCRHMFIAAVTAVVAESGIHGLVDYDLSSYGAKYFWFPLGLMLAAMNILKTENALHENALEG